MVCSMNSIKVSGLAVVGWVLLMAPSLASAAACPGSMPAPKRYMCLATEKQLLKLELQIATARQQIAKESAAGPRAASAVRAQAKLPVPDVLAIYGMSRLTAVLRWHSASGRTLGTMPVMAGATVPGGWHVVSVTPSAVVVRRHGRPITLLMSASGGNSRRHRHHHHRHEGKGGDPAVFVSPPPQSGPALPPSGPALPSPGPAQAGQ